MRKTLVILAVAVFSFCVVAEEGMYPLSELNRLNLADRDLQLSVKDIYNNRGTGLVNAIVRVGGCTGSFVSPNGLIITNHHCAFGSVQAASDAEHNYVRDGLSARDLTGEIPAKGLTVRITESYTDVSKAVLSALTDQMSPLERTRALERKIKELEKAAETETPGMRAEVAEMFPGRTYWLFRYTYLRDVRLVYVPPRSIGEYGGETDNWVWPRHTGDFSFMRAYVGPDGKPADYNTENVPYQPRRFLKVNPAGVNEGDAVFVLGYPGRTFRHRTAHYMAYQYEVSMPRTVEYYQWQINLMEEISAEDPIQAIQLSARIKGLANVMKKYRGQIKAMRDLDLVQQKKQQELSLQKFIQADPERTLRYGKILGEIGEYFEDVRQTADRDNLFSSLGYHVLPLRTALTVVEAANEKQKPDLDREARYMERNLPQTIRYTRLLASRIHREADSRILTRLLTEAIALPEGQQIDALASVLGESPDKHVLTAFVNNLFDGSDFSSDELDRLMQLDVAQLEQEQNPFIQLARALYPEVVENRERNRERKGKLDVLQGHLLDVKQQYAGAAFIPDANSTFRMTFGYVRGYSPADAVWYAPITTLAGVMQKATGISPFNPPEKLTELARKDNFSTVPVAILYDTDTTGGNSGSPVMDSRGNLVGVNFDRATEATINDYAWSSAYSRSIGVDIRYVLFILKHFAGMETLLQEMSIPVH